MSKKKQKQSSDNQRDKGFKIPDEVKRLVKLNFKKFKKDNDDYYDSKKELRKAYFAQIVELLPEAIVLIVRYGHLNDVRETKEAIYEKMVDEDFIKYLKKELKSETEVQNIEMMPHIIYDIVKEAAKAVEAEKAENPDSNVTYELDDLVELAQIILKKKMKKMLKAGIDEKLAFDVLSIIPDPCILKKNQFYHLRSLFTALYEHAKTKEVNFEQIIKILLKGDEDYTGSVITFALLERKEKITNFTDNQRNLFNKITEWCFGTLEEMSRDETIAVLKAYAESRKRDAAQNKDSNRRYYISSLPQDDYPKILKAVEKICERDENLKKFF